MPGGHDAVLDRDLLKQGDRGQGGSQTARWPRNRQEILRCLDSVVNGQGVPREHARFGETSSDRGASRLVQAVEVAVRELIPRCHDLGEEVRVTAIDDHGERHSADDSRQSVIA